MGMSVGLEACSILCSMECLGGVVGTEAATTGAAAATTEGLLRFVKMYGCSYKIKKDKHEYQNKS